MRLEDFKDKTFFISEIKNGVRRDIKIQFFKEICTVYLFRCNVDNYINIVSIEGLGDILVISRNILENIEQKALIVLIWQAILNSQSKNINTDTIDKLLVSVCGKTTTLNGLNYLRYRCNVSIDINRIHRIEKMSDNNELSIPQIYNIMAHSRLLKSISLGGEKHEEVS